MWGEEKNKRRMGEEERQEQLSNSTLIPTTHRGEFSGVLSPRNIHKSSMKQPWKLKLVCSRQTAPSATASQGMRPVGPLLLRPSCGWTCSGPGGRRLRRKEKAHLRNDPSGPRMSAGVINGLIYDTLDGKMHQTLPKKTYEATLQLVNLAVF